MVGDLHTRSGPISGVYTVKVGFGRRSPGRGVYLEIQLGPLSGRGEHMMACEWKVVRAFEHAPRSTATGK